MSDTGQTSKIMAKDETEPPNDRREQIIRTIQNHDHDVLTTQEIHEKFPNLSIRQIRRNLRWLKFYDVIEGRKPEEGEFWLWWVPARNLSASDSIATARQIQNYLGDLYRGRWEFRIIAAGFLLLIFMFSLTSWAVFINVFRANLISTQAILTILLIGYVLAGVLIFFGLFIFPVETWGNW